jgi:putative transcriptional regulator
MAEMAFQENRRISLEEISQKTGVNRTTLSKMINIRGYNTTVENLDRLCEFFGCQLAELAEYVYVAPTSTKVDNTEGGT